MAKDKNLREFTTTESSSSVQNTEEDKRLSSNAKVALTIVGFVVLTLVGAAIGLVCAHFLPALLPALGIWAKIGLGAVIGMGVSFSSIGLFDLFDQNDTQSGFIQLGAGAVGIGAGIGALVGSFLFPGLGSAIGAAVGAALGAGVTAISFGVYKYFEPTKEIFLIDSGEDIYSSENSKDYVKTSSPLAILGDNKSTNSPPKKGSDNLNNYDPLFIDKTTETSKTQESDSALSFNS